MMLTCRFAGGLGCGEVCGVVAGAVMIIGLKYGQYMADDKASKEKCYEITSKFMEEFIRRKRTFGSREILGYDVRDTHTRARFPGKQKQVYPKVIETAYYFLKR
jgi:C_GCAxxG_C_C family probable redox protein